MKHFELCRYSGTALGSLPRRVEKLVPADRFERISLFPAFDQPDKAQLLGAVTGHLELMGFSAFGAPDSDGITGGNSDHDSSEAFKAEALRPEACWPGAALLLERGGDDGVVLCADMDGHTLRIDTWGPLAGDVANELFEIIWAAVKGSSS